MHAGVPLTDDDRWSWLDRLAELVAQHAARSEPAVLACSALKASYRKRLCSGNVFLSGAAKKPHMVLLDPPEPVLRKSLEIRAATTDHFMPMSLLTSQLMTLERPLSPIFLAQGGDVHHCNNSKQPSSDDILLHLCGKSGMWPDIDMCVELINQCCCHAKQ
uniref:gluconokinase n=2 Tax=Chlamydomonas euryale TaxID=1486919 RepID=A0A7R9VZS8_9CHLO|mmetsp:Transcript_8789/g.26662  ORF Transcript_8789/g.26662 Transcript_8789/m.26662 type:complete len:161 (+) Transcript_8789:427-909(+)